MYTYNNETTTDVETLIDIVNGDVIQHKSFTGNRMTVTNHPDKSLIPIIILQRELASTLITVSVNLLEKDNNAVETKFEGHHTGSSNVKVSTVTNPCTKLLASNYQCVLPNGDIQPLVIKDGFLYRSKVTPTTVMETVPVEVGCVVNLGRVCNKGIGEVNVMGKVVAVTDNTLVVTVEDVNDIVVFSDSKHVTNSAEFGDEYTIRNVEAKR